MSAFSAYDTPKFPSEPQGDEPAARRVPRWAVIGIFLIMLAGFIIEARSFLMPVTLAFLLFFVFVPFRRALARIGVGPSAAAGIITLGMIAVVVVLGYLMSGPVSQIMDNAPQISQRLEKRFGEIKASIKPLQDAAAKIDEVTAGGATTDSAVTATAGGSTAKVSATTPSGAPAVPEHIKVEVKSDANAAPTTLERMATLGPAVGGQIVFTLVLFYFMMASGDLLYLKIVQSFDRTKDKRAAYTALRDIEDRIGAYLGAITWINAGVGVAIGLAMWAWGMPNPLLWGVAGFLLNYIPYLGPIGGMATAAVVALFVYDGIGTPLLVGLTYITITSIEGQFITPTFVSRRLELNEVVVFLTVALWAFFWSILGMMIAVPLLVVLRVLAEHIPGLEKFGNFLAGEAPPVISDDDDDIDPTPDDLHESEAREILEAGEEARSADEAEALIADAATESEAAQAQAAAAPRPAPPEDAIIVAPVRGAVAPDGGTA